MLADVKRIKINQHFRVNNDFLVKPFGTCGEQWSHTHWWDRTSENFTFE